jgi:hypothetical protein
MGRPTGDLPGGSRLPRQLDAAAVDRAARLAAEGIRLPHQRDTGDVDRAEAARYDAAPTAGASDDVVVPHQVRDERRGEVVLRHARLTGRGRPTFCSPTRAEQAGVVRIPTGKGTDGKVIYPTREAAEAAARELESLGARRLRPYLCARSRHGHFHLTTDTSRSLHERIPQQRRSA